VLDAVLGEEVVAVFLCERAVATPHLQAFVREGVPPAACTVERFYLEKVSAKVGR
jgi:hypothetical protein